MHPTYSATYHTAAGHFYQATIFLSAVTITVRYVDENNQQRDVYWLTNQLAAVNEQAIGIELTYRNNDGTTERLGIQDAALIAALTKTLGHHRLFGKPHQRAMGSIWTKLMAIALIVIAIIAALYLWLAPWIGERIAKGFSKETEINMGEQLYQNVIKQYTIDTGKTAALNAFYKQLHYEVGYPVQITVVESGISNAFAMPGGHIVVHTAIFDEMKAPEQLAALLGHEASHIGLRHSLRNIFRSLARKMFVALVFGNESGITSVIIDNAESLKGLEYSRSLETEADDNGLQLMVKNNIDPQGMVRLMQMLQRQTGEQETVSFLSTHPVFKDRIKHIEATIKRLPATTTADSSLRQLFHAIYE